MSKLAICCCLFSSRTVKSSALRSLTMFPFRSRAVRLTTTSSVLERIVKPGLSVGAAAVCPTAVAVMVQLKNVQLKNVQLKNVQLKNVQLKNVLLKNVLLNRRARHRRRRVPAFGGSTGLARCSLKVLFPLCRLRSGTVR